MVIQDKKVWGILWYRNDTPSGALAQAVADCGKDEIVVHSHTNNHPRLYAHITPKQMLKLLETNKGIFECLSHYPKKVYFDIDCKRKEMGDKFNEYHTFNKEYLEDCCDIIGDHFRNADLAISGSITSDAISLHITLTNYVIQNKEQLEMMKHIVKEMKAKEPTFDDKVYTRNRFMKAVNQTKPNDPRVQCIIKNHDMKEHLITCFFNKNPLPFPEPKPEVLENIRVEQAKKPIDYLTDLPKLDKIVLDEVKKHILEEYELEQMTPSQLLQLMPQGKEFPHSHSWRMCRFAYYNNIPIEEFIAWYRQKHDDQESINKYTQIHYPNAHKYTEPTIQQIQKILIKYYPKLVKDIHYRRFTDTFELPTDKIQKVDTISQQCYKPTFYEEAGDVKQKNRCVIFNTGMGSGKTHQTIEYLHHNSEKSFIWVCPNRALAHNTLSRLEEPFTTTLIKVKKNGVKIEYNVEITPPDEEGCNIKIVKKGYFVEKQVVETTTNKMSVAHYERFTKKEKDDGCFNTINRLIIVANSLHYIKQKTYHTIVIDEIETLLDKWEGSFINEGGNKLASWNAFINIFKNAKKIILLDAFITTKTISFLESVGIMNYTIFERKVEPTTRNIHYYSSWDVMVKMIMEDLKSKKKVFIFYPYKDGTEKYMSMVSFANMLELACDVKGSFYNADVDDKKKAEVKDVNFSWCNKNFIITNNMITCGVNYDTDEPSQQFDKKYLFVASMNSPRDIIQVSYRARALKDNAINVCFLGRMMQNNIWEDDTKSVMADCPIYRSLYDTILTEKKSPLRKTFAFFCNKAHYTQHTEKKCEIDDALTKEIKELKEKYNIDFDFTKVENIDHSYAEIIRQKTICHDATMYEKVMLKKYHFLSNFTETSHSLIFDDQEGTTFTSFLWNNNLIKFVDKIFENADKKESVFKMLQTHYGWDTIFPLKVDKRMKMTDALKEQFFKEFQYKFCSMKSKLPHLLTITYNGYFGKDIIQRTYDDSKNVNYSIDHSIITPMYKFCMDHRFNLEKHQEEQKQQHEASLLCLLDDDEE